MLDAYLAHCLAAFTIHSELSFQGVNTYLQRAESVFVCSV